MFTYIVIGGDANGLHWISYHAHTDNTLALNGAKESLNNAIEEGQYDVVFIAPVTDIWKAE